METGDLSPGLHGNQETPCPGDIRHKMEYF